MTDCFPWRPVVAAISLALCAVEPGSAQFFAGALTPIDLHRPAGATDSDLTMSLDELVAVFTSDRPGSLGKDLWLTKRADREQSWGIPSRLAVVNSAADEGSAALSADGLRLYFETDRSGGPGPRNIMVSRRTSRAVNFRAPNFLPGAVNAIGRSVGDPHLAMGGQRLFYTSDQSGGGDLYIATRTTGGGFGSPQSLSAANHPTARDFSPATEAGGAVVWFSSDRPGGAGGADLYVTYNAVGAASWSVPLAVVELNDSGDQTGAFRSLSAGTMYAKYEPGDVGCICKNGSSGGSLGGLDGTVRVNASSAAWSYPLVFMPGAEWQVGASQSLSFYEWDPIEPVTSWFTFVAPRRLAQPIYVPGITDGAIELDGLQLLGSTLATQSGYATLSIQVPNMPRLRGIRLWTQSVGATASGKFRLALPERVTLR